jgi:branched-chain amino acid transport system substrate-binding protein
LNEWHKQGLSDRGYTLAGPGALTDEAVLTALQAAAEGVVSAYFWSPKLDNADNATLVKAFPQEYTDDETGAPVPLSGYAVEMWDAIHALDVALAHGLDVAALEAVSFASPRGQFAFDKAAHSPVQDVFVRQVKSVDGKWVNSVVERIPRVAPI